jgi:essential nuclear protein 1
MQLIRKKSHVKITPEIRRELQAAKPRDAEVDAPMHCEGDEEAEMDTD